MGYLTPADVAVTDDYGEHQARNSAEPGTDYATAYGTDLRLAGDGVVAVADHSLAGAEGRRFSIDLEDGRRVSYIHLSAIDAYVGQRVYRGQHGIIRSGSSGYGNEWHYAPHVHVSLWERPGMPYDQTIDFEAYLADDEPAPIIQGNEDSMYLVWYGDTVPAEGWLMSATAQVGVRSERDYDLLKRVIASDQSATHPAHFNYAERDIINGYLRELAAASRANAPTGSTATLTAPAWVISALIGLIGLVELLRLVLDR